MNFVEAISNNDLDASYY